MPERSRSSAKQRTIDRIYEQVRDAILSGEYAPEARLTEETLGERYGASRTPVRAALLKLASDGFIEMTPRTGAAVKRRSLVEVAEIFDVRSLLESTAAGLAAERRRDEAVQTLVQLQDQMDAVVATGDIDNLSRLNKKFHHIILLASGNRTLLESAVRLMDIGFLAHTYSDMGQHRIARSFADHRNLIAAIESRDKEWAAALMRSHILAARNTLTNTLARQRQA